MPKSPSFLILAQLFFLLSLLPNDASGEQDAVKTRYVSDYLKINIKDRLEKPYEVVTTVQSDDPVQLLEESENYWKISTPDGKEGWIAKHYLKSELPKSTIIKQLRQENADLKAKLTAQPPGVTTGVSGAGPSDSTSCKVGEEKLKAAEETIISLQKQLSEALAAPPQVTTVDASQLSGETTPENHAWLVEEYEKRGEQIEELQKTLAKKEDRTRFLWFTAGALVFLVGVLAGRTGNRKKNKLLY